MTAGYSGTPLVRKLGVRAGDRLVLLDAPDGWTVPDLPRDVVVADRGAGEAQVVLAFFRDRATLLARAAAVAAELRHGAMLWVAWPRRAGGHTSDIAENDLRAVLLPVGLVDVKVAALDEDWSGLKFVWRRAHV
ncbi:DUF3052 domain-containing protein [Nocardia thailandica]